MLTAGTAAEEATAANATGSGLGCSIAVGAGIGCCCCCAFATTTTGPSVLTLAFRSESSIDSSASEMAGRATPAARRGCAAAAAGGAAAGGAGAAAAAAAEIAAEEETGESAPAVPDASVSSQVGGAYVPAGRDPAGTRHMACAGSDRENVLGGVGAGARKSGLNGRKKRSQNKIVFVVKGGKKRESPYFSGFARKKSARSGPRSLSLSLGLCSLCLSLLLSSRTALSTSIVQTHKICSVREEELKKG